MSVDMQHIRKKSIHSLKKKLAFIEKRTRAKFTKAYASTPTHHLTSIINNIIYNEKSHIVAVFKDYLILDDVSEFLKRYYTRPESSIRLPRFFEYYDTYSKIFPNYTSIYEGKYIYRNIQRKQRMIDLQEKMELETQKNKKFSQKQNKEKEQEVFVTEVYDSIMNATNRENIGILFGMTFTQRELDEDDGKFYDKVDGIIDVIEKGINSKKINAMPHQGKLVLKQVLNSNNNNIMCVGKCNEDENNSRNININNNINLSHRKWLSNTERTLNEKIEFNFFDKENNNNINNNNNCENAPIYVNNSNNQRQPEQHPPTILSTKMNELKMLYHKKMRSYNLMHQKANLNNCTNFPNSPNTERTASSKKHSRIDSISTGRNNNNVNNIVYIINQNPKITNHINIYNSLTNNNSVSSRNRHLQMNSTSKNKNNINLRQLLLSGKIKTKNSSPNRNFIFSSSMKRIRSTVNNSNNNTNTLSQNKKPIKKRNITSSCVNSMNSNSSNNNMMRTAREMNYKIAEMLRKHDNNNYINKPTENPLYQSQQNLIANPRNNSNNNQKDMPPPTTRTFLNNNYKNEKVKISRNKRAGSHEQQSNDNYYLTNKKHYYMSKNDSVNKLQQQFNSGGSTNTNPINPIMKKKIIKGIQIKNFNRIYAENISSATTNFPKSQTNRKNNNINNNM